MEVAPKARVWLGPMAVLPAASGMGLTASGPTGYRGIACGKWPAYLLGRKGVCALRQGGARVRGQWRLAERCQRQARLQRMGQAPGAGGVWVIFAVLVAGSGAGCKRIHIACGCKGCGAANHLLDMPRLMQGRTRQRVEQRHQQKHDGGKAGRGWCGAAWCMRIIRNCQEWNRRRAGGDF